MKWSEEDDRRLWSARSKPKSQLASTFGKSIGAIRSRLKHLQDPTHKAYGRRVGRSSSAAASRSSGLREMVSSHRSASRSISRSSHGMPGMSSFASGYAAAKKSSGASPRPKSDVVDLTGASPFGGNNAASKGPSPKSDAELYAQIFPPSESSPPPSAVTSIANAHLKASSPSVESVSSQHQQNEKPIDSSSLNFDQKAASDYIFSGGNAFLTGAAGVGKSYLLRHLIQGLRSKHERMTNRGGSFYVPTSRDPAVAVTAATGIAATHINGVTIHSWAGVQLGQGGARVLVPRVMRNAAACRRWKAAKVLVLDEVSMIDGMFFEALDAIGREVRGRPSVPFGGIQLVLSGDFFQLPPVSLGRCGFAFECPAWSAAGVKMVELTTVVRQQGDRTFVDLLGEIRLGRCPEGLTRALESCHVSRKAPPADGIVPTKLYCTNRNVDEENNRKLGKLPGKEHRFRASDEFKGRYSKQVESGLSQTMDKKVPSELCLKEGAQVILTRNMPEHKLVNGSRGIVKLFEEERKNQDGNVYAISRSGSSKQRYPVVHFSNGVRMMVREESVFQGGASGGMTRRQLPLKLGWSLTVHKSQGMTIERAELQLDDAFDFGQVYVALSRVTSLVGLWVRGGRVTQSVVKAHPKVIAFYQRNGSSLLASG